MKSFALLTAIVLLSSACQKELSYEVSSTGGHTPPPDSNSNPPTGSYYIRFKMNGTSRTFNHHNMARVTDLGPGGKTLSLLGSATSTIMHVEGLTLNVLYLNGQVKAGTFREGDVNFSYAVDGVYQSENNNISYRSGLQPVPQLPLTITVSKLNEQVAEGTFQGAFYQQDPATGGATAAAPVVFTEGAFLLPVK